MRREIVEIANGRKPQFEIDQVFYLEDGTTRRIVFFTSGQGGKVKFKQRKGPTGVWGKQTHELPRRLFWKGVIGYKPAAL